MTEAASGRYQAQLAFARPADVSPDTARRGLLRARTLAPEEQGRTASFDLHRCPLQDLAAEGAPTPDLARMGFDRRNLDFFVDFESLDGFERVRPSKENPFAWGVLTLGDGRRVGVVRIAHFGEDGYPEVAALLWPAFAEGRDGHCDGWCQWDFWNEVADDLLRHLAEGTRHLVERGIDALLVDIARNGGGTDWAAVAPRIFTPPLQRCRSQKW